MLMKGNKKQKYSNNNSYNQNKNNSESSYNQSKGYGNLSSSSVNEQKVQIPVSSNTQIVSKRNSVRTSLIFIIGFTVGILFMSSWTNMSTTKTITTANDTGTGVATSTTPINAQIGITKNTTSAGIARGSILDSSDSGAVSVSDQVAGASVLVDSVTVPPPGVWVTVQETRGNTLGNVLGATLVNGPISNVVVSLLRNTEPNRTYAVVLYRDGGNGGLFDLKTDSVYVDFDSGKRVVVPFKTTAVSTNN